MQQRANTGPSGKRIAKNPVPSSESRPNTRRWRGEATFPSLFFPLSISPPVGFFLALPFDFCPLIFGLPLTRPPCAPTSASAYCLLLTAFCLLPSADCLLPTAYRSIDGC